MPVWLIPILAAALGGAAGQATGHNTKSTMEGMGMGALLGMGGAGAAGAGAAGGAADAGAAAGATGVSGADALGAAGMTDAGMADAGAVGAGTGMIAPMAGDTTYAGSLFGGSSLGGAGDATAAGDAIGSMTGGATNASVAAGLSPAGGGYSDAMDQLIGPMTSTYQAPGAANAAGAASNAASSMNSPAMWANLQKYGAGVGKQTAQQLATQAAMQAVTPKQSFSQPGQPFQFAPQANMQPGAMNMPNYTQQLAALGF